MHHRHVSHLFGLYPGHTITVEKTPDLCKAVDYTLYKRGLHLISVLVDYSGLAVSVQLDRHLDTKLMQIILFFGSPLNILLAHYLTLSLEL